MVGIAVLLHCEIQESVLQRFCLTLQNHLTYGNSSRSILWFSSSYRASREALLYVMTDQPNVTARLIVFTPNLV